MFLSSDEQPSFEQWPIFKFQNPVQAASQVITIKVMFF
jgi:hypothetical protein